MTQAWSVDSTDKISGLCGNNHGLAQTLPASISLFGRALSFPAFSSMSRTGHSASVSTLWVSETSLKCLFSSHSRGTRHVVVTIVEQAGTATHVLSSDRSIVQIAPHNNNRASTGSTSVTVRGAGYGLIAHTIILRLGASCCEATKWESDTGVCCMVTQGVRISQSLSMTGGILSSSSSSVFSFDCAVGSSLLSSNAHATGSIFVTIMGAALGATANSQGSRTGLSASESTIWISTSSVACRQSSGVQSSKILHITVAPHSGSMTQAISYNTASISTYEATLSGSARICTLSLYGTAFSLQDTSVQVRVGSTGAETTFWKAETSVICKQAHGTPAHDRVVLTIGERQSTVTNIHVYQPPVMSSILSSNIAMCSPPSILYVFGWNYGFVSLSSSIRLGVTACLNTQWMSDSSLRCKPARGFSEPTSQLPVILSMGAIHQKQVHTLSISFSYDKQECDPMATSTSTTVAPSSSTTGVA
eukprot:CAMPEP_0179482012 /NCGR_PEP_ID=MMETSP0799-20121207/59610_1 /TAXON_ID=46947 /ORGANISM="Geminigera cryophila, Strain CCMP2564" /LENGTH=475 /DNA_ID=CAMNT_0021294933 /DNA_START=9 /DNA_END=1432 /DNA_ORIENTATION=-